MKFKDEMFQVIQILYKAECAEAKSPSSVKELDYFIGEIRILLRKALYLICTLTGVAL